MLPPLEVFFLQEANDEVSRVEISGLMDVIQRLVCSNGGWHLLANDFDCKKSLLMSRSSRRTSMWHFQNEENLVFQQKTKNDYGSERLQCPLRTIPLYNAGWVFMASIFHAHKYVKQIPWFSSHAELICPC